MSVINELHEVSSPHAEHLRSSKDRMYALKNIIDGLLEKAEETLPRQKKNQTVVEGSRMQRYNSEAMLFKHMNLQQEVRKDLEVLDNVESKVTTEIITLRNDKIRLIRTLNE